MKLIDLQKNDEAHIVGMDVDAVLKGRLYSFGIIKGTKIKVKEFSLNKKTVEIEVNRSFIALRFEEAQKIEVEK